MIAIGTLLRSKRVQHVSPYRPEVRRIAGAAPRGNGKGAPGAASPARPVEGVDQAIAVRGEPVVFLRQRAAPPGEGVVLRNEVRAPGLGLTPKICELGIEAADLRLYGLELCANAVEPGLQRLALA